MPITAIVNVNQGTSVQVTNPKTIVSVLPIQTTATSVQTSLDHLTDVDATSPDNNDTLVYDSIAGKYVIKIIPVIQGGTF